MESTSIISTSDFLRNKRVLVTGGAGFIGGTLARELITLGGCKVFNLDKLSYSSDLSSIDILEKNNPDLFKDRYQFFKADLNNFSEIKEVMKIANPDLIFHLAAESHVDRSIDGPRPFVMSNIVGTFNLLEAALMHFQNLKAPRKSNFRFLHISTDEVFGSLGEDGFFSEDSKYDPRSPYSASKASSDHLVRAWHHTYKLPTLITNCSNNFGPWQFPEKLIPLVINKAVSENSIPIYGTGKNIRDWLYVDDHINALLKVINQGIPGKTYCIGSNNEKTNLEIAQLICDNLDKIIPLNYSRRKLIKFVTDRPGHDKRYAINSSFITSNLSWKASYDFNESLEKTVKWYINNKNWCEKVLKKSNYKGERIGQK
mgnify:FL=1